MPEEWASEALFKPIAMVKLKNIIAKEIK